MEDRLRDKDLACGAEKDEWVEIQESEVREVPMWDETVVKRSRRKSRTMGLRSEQGMRQKAGVRGPKKRSRQRVQNEAWVKKKNTGESTELGFSKIW